MTVWILAHFGSLISTVSFPIKFNWLSCIKIHVRCFTGNSSLTSLTESRRIASHKYVGGMEFLKVSGLPTWSEQLHLWMGFSVYFPVKFWISSRREIFLQPSCRVWLLFLWKSCWHFYCRNNPSDFCKLCDSKENLPLLSQNYSGTELKIYLVKKCNVEWKAKSVLQADFVSQRITELFSSCCRVCQQCLCCPIHKCDRQHDWFLGLGCLKD